MSVWYISVNPAPNALLIEWCAELSLSLHSWRAGARPACNNFIISSAVLHTVMHHTIESTLGTSLRCFVFEVFVEIFEKIAHQQITAHIF